MTFFQSNEELKVSRAGNQLSYTAELTLVATQAADDIMSKVMEDPQQHEDQVLASQKSHDAMDDLISEFINLAEIDVQFLDGVDDETMEKMIRSQQSKRSRAKSKIMTKENYMTMLIGAISENLLRLKAGKPKNATYGGLVMTEVGFSEEDLERLADFPEELKRAIRNVQSKKSIMRRKADFDEESQQWIKLLEAEAQLKGVRDRVNGVASEKAKLALEAQKKSEELLADIDLENVSADEAVDLLSKMKEMLATS